VIAAMLRTRAQIAAGILFIASLPCELQGEHQHDDEIPAVWCINGSRLHSDLPISLCSLGPMLGATHAGFPLNRINLL